MHRNWKWNSDSTWEESICNKSWNAIAKLTNEIEWETLDGKGVKVILLFAVGDKTEDAQEHLKLLAQVAGKLGNDEIVEKLLKAESVEEIKSVFL